MSELQYFPSCSFVVPACHSSVFLKEPSTEGPGLVIVLVLFQLLPGCHVSRVKCESIKSYGCAALEQKARTVLSVQV